MDDNRAIRQYINDQVAAGANRKDVLNELRSVDDPRVQYFFKEIDEVEKPQKEEKALDALGAETAAAAIVGKKILDMFGKGPAEPPSPPPGGGAVASAPVAPPSAPPATSPPIPPSSNVGQQMQGLDWEKLPQWQKDVLLAGYQAEQDKKAAQSFEETRIAKQKEALNAINQSPAAAQAAQQALQPTVAPTVSQVAQQAAPAITQASQAPAATIGATPAESAKFDYKAVTQMPGMPGVQPPVQPPVTANPLVQPVPPENKFVQPPPTQPVEPPPVSGKLVTGTGREVVEGQGPVKTKFSREYATPLDVPKGYVFLPEGQYIDVLRNDLGQKTYTEQFKNRPFPTNYEAAVQTGKDINRELNRPTREQLIASGGPMAETTTGITKKVGPSKKVVVGGVAGSLLAVADVANASTMRQAAQNLGEALLPMGVTPSQAGAPVLPPSVLAAQKRQMEEMQKLGSPYRKR